MLLIRLNRGERLIEQLDTLAVQEKLSGAWLSGLGGAEQAELGFYDLDTQEYQWQTFTELMEITSLQGNLAWIDGNTPKWHIHGTVSGRDYRAIGGHVKELVVGGTCELLVWLLPESTLYRREDNETGLQLLDLSN